MGKKSPRCVFVALTDSRTRALYPRQLPQIGAMRREKRTALARRAAEWAQDGYGV